MSAPFANTPAPDAVERAHTHHLDGRDVECRHLTHCPAYCACPVDECTAALDPTGPCPDCGRRMGWDGHAYGPCGVLSCSCAGPGPCPLHDDDPQPNAAAFAPRRRGTGPNARVRAASLYAAWRADGVPRLVTAHEAYRLTDGKVGTDGDHGTPLNLSTVARLVEGGRR